MNINSLPIELFLEILTNIDGKTLGKCRGVCKKWKNTIDNNDMVWKVACRREFKHPSKIAKERSNNDCTWYIIYKNLTCWNDVTSYSMRLRDFYEFPVQELSRNFENKQLQSFRTDNTRKKIANNTYALVIYFKNTVIIVRPAETTEIISEKFYQADGFSLWSNQVYFYKNKDVYVVNLDSLDLESTLFYTSPFQINEIHHFDGKTYLFTKCGQIITIGNSVVIQPINCPQVWLPQIKYINAIDDKNYVCYSRNLFNIETDKCRHLYLEFPLITALFFYGEFVVIGMRTGDLWIYRLSSQERGKKPVFEFLSNIPGGQHAIQIDVVERSSGPVIIVITLTKVYFLEIVFFGNVKDEELPLSMKRLSMYKRLLSIRDTLNNRISCSVIPN